MRARVANVPRGRNQVSALLDDADHGLQAPSHALHCATPHTSRQWRFWFAGRPGSAPEQPPRRHPPRPGPARVRVAHLPPARGTERPPTPRAGNQAPDAPVRGIVRVRARRSQDDPPSHRRDSERPQGLDRARRARSALRGAGREARRRRAANAGLPGEEPEPQDPRARGRWPRDLGVRRDPAAPRRATRSEGPDPAEGPASSGSRRSSTRSSRPAASARTSGGSARSSASPPPSATRRS